MYAECGGALSDLLTKSEVERAWDENHDADGNLIPLSELYPNLFPPPEVPVPVPLSSIRIVEEQPTFEEKMKNLQREATEQREECARLSEKYPPPALKEAAIVKWLEIALREAKAGRLLTIYSVFVYADRKVRVGWSDDKDADLSKILRGIDLLANEVAEQQRSRGRLFHVEPTGR